MANRKRNLRLGLWLSEEEKNLIKSVADLKGMLVTNLIVELVKNEHEKLEKEQDK